jgi:hypothetical protein
MRSVIVCLLVLIWFSNPVRSQFVGHVTQGAWRDDGEFWYAALSCSGNKCVALGLGINGGDLIFLRSSDGGDTWKLQDSFRVSGTWFESPNLATFVRIDSLNIVAFGRSDTIYRTTDDGVTWHEQHIPTTGGIDDISFSNPNEGYLVITGINADTVFQTSDGGETWVESPLTLNAPIANCHVDSHRAYSLFRYGLGTVYTTSDNWISVDSTKPIVDRSLASHYVFSHCVFSGKDTLIAFGNYLNEHTTPYPLIARTTNAGQDWTFVYDDTVTFTANVHALSDIGRDTIVAGTSGQPGLLMSTDRGRSWQPKTLVCKDTNAILATNAGIGLNAQGSVVGSYGFGKLSSSLIVASQAPLVVQWRENNVANNFYPNPATSFVTVSTRSQASVHFFNLLGREVLSGQMCGGERIFDMSQLPSGVYSVFINYNGGGNTIGSIIVERK